MFGVHFFPHVKGRLIYNRENTHFFLIRKESEIPQPNKKFILAIKMYFPANTNF